MKIHLPAFGPDLPVHPFTGLTALGLRRNGAAIWPVKGGAPGEGEGEGGDSGNPGSEGEGGQLGDAGKKALDAMKAERNAARKELTALKVELDKLSPLQKLAEALGAKPDGDGDGKPDIEALTKRLAGHEAELAAERVARYRAEVAAEKQLTPAQARRLVGTTREELAKDADELLKDFAQQNGGGRQQRAPRPDPSQGSRGGKPLSGREQALQEVEKRFGTKSAVT